MYQVQDCDCGYTDVSDPTRSVFNSLFFVDFKNTTKRQLEESFRISTYPVRHNVSEALTRNYTLSNTNLSQAGLNLTVSPRVGDLVPSGGIVSKSTAFGFGSYHISYRTTNVPGTVAGFFTYRDENSAVDAEYLSWDPNPSMLYSVKPQIYEPNGVASNLTFRRERWTGAKGTFSQKFHDWSFVWLPEVVHFGLDGNYTTALRTRVPSQPGHLALGHWSDGNSHFSRGPPTQNAVLTASHVWAVYNNSNTTLTCQKTQTACNVLDGKIQVSRSTGHGVVSVDSSTSAAPFTGPAMSSWALLLVILSWFHVL
ncbi:hypothetical protein NX059_011694 [Plenodomus lindquistii]|nr:hypothetical protein NX059_011694 [Plenodomus lindquistii]